jgi:thiol-disulfide isomerase/thioredoxin
MEEPFGGAMKKIAWILLFLIFPVYGQQNSELEKLKQEIHSILSDSTKKKEILHKNLLMAKTPVDEEILLIGKEAPRFVLPDINNEYVFLRYYCGKQLKRSVKIKNQEKQVVILSFFASWCKPCKKELPHFQKVADEFKDYPVKFFLVNVGEDRETAIRFAKSLGLHLPILLDTYKKVSENYKVETLPRIVLLDKNGVVRGYKIGYAEDDQLEKKLKIALLLLVDDLFYQ